ncbi:MAG: AAA family ATPase, partial [Limisphaerales bacterium]
MEKNPAFAKLYRAYVDVVDDPDNTSHYENRMAALKDCLREWFDTFTIAHAAVFCDGWRGAGRRVESKREKGDLDDERLINAYAIAEAAILAERAGEAKQHASTRVNGGEAFEAVESDDAEGTAEDQAEQSSEEQSDEKSELAEYRNALKALPKFEGRPTNGLRTALDHLREFAPQDELVEGLWPVTGVCSVYGDANSGKTFFCFAAGKAVAKGSQFNGGDTQKAGVLYFGSEGREGTDARMTALYAPMTDAEAKAMGLDARDFATPDAADTIHTNFEFPFDAKSARAACARFYRIACDFKNRYGEFPGLVMIDHIVAMLPAGTDLNDAVAMKVVYNALGDLQRVLGCLIVVIGHTNKTDGYLGSVIQRAAWTRSIRIEKKGSGEAAVHCIHNDKIRDGLSGGSSNTFRLVTRSIGTT